VTGARPWDATQTAREITGAKPAARLAAFIGGAAVNQIESVKIDVVIFDADLVAQMS